MNTRICNYTAFFNMSAGEKNLLEYFQILTRLKFCISIIWQQIATFYIRIFHTRPPFHFLAFPFGKLAADSNLYYLNNRPIISSSWACHNRRTLFLVAYIQALELRTCLKKLTKLFMGTRFCNYSASLRVFSNYDEAETTFENAFRQV